MHSVEKEIDAKVESMPLWKHGRGAMLEALMGSYREDIEFTFVRLVFDSRKLKPIVSQ